jgi:hypothetical protein
MRGWVVLALVLASGCGTAKLATGYQPRPLGANDTVRRSYYAAPFTAGAQSPEAAKQQEMESRRPKSY